MNTTSDYLSSLQDDLTNYKSCLSALGISTSNDDTFTTLNTKLENYTPSGGDSHIHKVSSFAEMEAISNPEIGDIAVAEIDTTSPLSQDFTSGTLTPVESITFDSPIDDYYSVSAHLDSGDFRIELSESNASIQYMSWESGEDYYASYSTEDGQTYTLDGSPESFTLTLSNGFEEFNSYAASLVNTGSTRFGIYSYQSKSCYNINDVINNRYVKVNNSSINLSELYGVTFIIDCTVEQNNVLTNFEYRFTMYESMCNDGRIYIDSNNDLHYLSTSGSHSLNVNLYKCNVSGYNKYTSENYLPDYVHIDTSVAQDTILVKNVNINRLIAVSHSSSPASSYVIYNGSTGSDVIMNIPELPSVSNYNIWYYHNIKVPSDRIGFLEGTNVYTNEGYVKGLFNYKELEKSNVYYGTDSPEDIFGEHPNVNDEMLYLQLSGNLENLSYVISPDDLSTLQGFSNVSSFNSGISGYKGIIIHSYSSNSGGNYKHTNKIYLVNKSTMTISNTFSEEYITSYNYTDTEVQHSFDDVNNLVYYSKKYDTNPNIYVRDIITGDLVKTISLNSIVKSSSAYSDINPTYVGSQNALYVFSSTDTFLQDTNLMKYDLSTETWSNCNYKTTEFWNAYGTTVNSDNNTIIFNNCRNVFNFDNFDMYFTTDSDNYSNVRKIIDYNKTDDIVILGSSSNDYFTGALYEYKYDTTRDRYYPEGYISLNANSHGSEYLSVCVYDNINNNLMNMHATLSNCTINYRHQISNMKVQRMPVMRNYSNNSLVIFACGGDAIGSISLYKKLKINFSNIILSGSSGILKVWKFIKSPRGASYSSWEIIIDNTQGN